MSALAELQIFWHMAGPLTLIPVADSATAKLLYKSTSITTHCCVQELANGLVTETLQALIMCILDLISITLGYDKHYPGSPMEDDIPQLRELAHDIEVSPKIFHPCRSWRVCCNCWIGHIYSSCTAVGDSEPRPVARRCQGLAQAHEINATCILSCPFRETLTVSEPFL